jgi:hypothetical protein
MKTVTETETETLIPQGERKEKEKVRKTRRGVSTALSTNPM